MAGERSPKLPRRRTAARDINYNEKKADTELANRIEQLEQARVAGKVSKCRRGRSGTISVNSNANSDDKIKYQKFLNDKSIEWNFIPTTPTFLRKTNRFSTILDLEDAYISTEEQCLYGPNCGTIKSDDTIYMVSEPPGEPYYVGRVVEFTAKPEFRMLIYEASRDLKRFPVKFFQVRMNWFYRSRDIQSRHNNVQPRLLYASLHQDICPIESYRGHCRVVHENEITTAAVDKFDFVTKPNNFYFNQLFDRYTRKYYKVVTSDDILKLEVSSPFLQILNARFRYLFIEENYPFEQIIEKVILKKDNNSHANDEFWKDCCSVCREWCSKSTCLECDECKQSVHLYCLDPPLDRKPNKGIVWYCFKCLKRQEGSEEAIKELEEDRLEEKQYIDSFRRDLNEASQKSLQRNNFTNRHYCFQYVGQTMLNHLKDLVCEHLFLPHPMKLSRVGYKYQWSGCSNEKGHPSKLHFSDFEREERGTDATSQLLWSMKDSNIDPDKVDRYMEKCKTEYPPKLNMLPESCNFLDLAAETLMMNDFNTELAFKACGKLASRKSLQEPTFTAEEIDRFEAAIAEFGSELLPVSKCVKTQPTSMVVRYYYQWKKTPNGRRIWGNFKGRKKNIGRDQVKVESSDHKPLEERKSKRERKPTKLALESKKDKSQESLRYFDDSSFEIENTASSKPYFQCMFCEVDYSPMWYKVTGGSDDEYVRKRMQTGVSEKTETSTKNSLVGKVSRTKQKEEKGKKLDALCIRCARIWRRYAVEWQHPLTVLKRLNGQSIASLYATLESIFSESNINLLQLSPQQAYNKCLEWELVQDSELITRQRKNMIRFPDRLSKLKKSSISTRAQLYKMVKRPFDRMAWDKDNMLLELQRYLDQHQVRKQKTVQGSNYKIDKVKTVKRQDLEANTNNKGNINGNLESKRHKLLKLTDDLKDSLSSNGDLQINVPLNEGYLGKITIDPDTKYLQLDEKIHRELKSHLYPPCRRENSANLLPLPSPNEKLKECETIPSYNGPKREEIPILSDERDTRHLLNMYHQLDPLHLKSNHEQHGQSKEIISIKKHVPIESDSSQSDLEKHNVYCNVCYEKFDQNRDDEINCHGCGLSVHYYCYGISLSADPLRRKLRSYTWFCDPCSNQVHPIVSTNYRCDLCYIKKIEDTFPKGHLDNPDPSALKCTTSGTWCHIICAVFNPDIRFGCASKLQPIINVNHVIAKNIGRFCSICKLEGGGLIKCSSCPVKFHATCARSTPGFSLKIMMTKNTDITRGNKPLCEINGREYFLSPVALCGNHENGPRIMDDLYPLSQKVEGKSKTLLQLYCETYKENARMSTVFTRYLEQRNIWRENIFEHLDRLEEGRMTHDLPENSGPSKLVKSEIKTCPACGTNRSLFWYDRNICHTCHISLGADIHKSSIKNPVRCQNQLHPCTSEIDEPKAADVPMPLRTDFRSEGDSSVSLAGQRSLERSKSVTETP